MAGDKDKAAMHAHLKAGAMDDVGAYARSGRVHRDVPDAELLKMWKEAVVAMAAEPFNASVRAAHRDVAAELNLRGVGPTEEDPEILAAMKRLAEVTVKFSERTLREFHAMDPDRQREVDRRLTADMDAQLGLGGRRKH